MTPEEAALYAKVHDGAPGDVAFYRARTEGVGRVLELGSGWGRVASALGCREVVGLESDPGMRALAKEQGFASVEGDMRDFSLGQFDKVIIPFTGIYCLLSEADLSACLSSVRRGLAPGGELIFDAYAADKFHAECLPEDYADIRREIVAEIEHDGATLTVWERSTWDRDAQRMDATYTYDDPYGHTMGEIEIGHRYLLIDQLEPVLAEAGLSLVSVAGSFEGEPFDVETSGSLVVTACAAEEAALGG